VSFLFDLYSAAVLDSPILWHGMCESALCVNQTRPHSVNQMGKTQSKPLAERYGRGTAWKRHGTCESALNIMRRNVIHGFRYKYRQSANTDSSENAV
jgi:hypothetical protein